MVSEACDGRAEIKYLLTRLIPPLHRPGRQPQHHRRPVMRRHLKPVMRIKQSHPLVHRMHHQRPYAGVLRDFDGTVDGIPEQSRSQPAAAGALVGGEALQHHDRQGILHIFVTVTGFDETGSVPAAIE